MEIDDIGLAISLPLDRRFAQASETLPVLLFGEFLRTLYHRAPVFFLLFTGGPADLTARERLTTIAVDEGGSEGARVVARRSSGAAGALRVRNFPAPP